MVCDCISITLLYTAKRRNEIFFISTNLSLFGYTSIFKHAQEDIIHIIILWTLGSSWSLNNLDQNVPVVGYRYLVTYPRTRKKYQRRGHAGWFLTLIFVRRYVYNCLLRVVTITAVTRVRLFDWYSACCV